MKWAWVSHDIGFLGTYTWDILQEPSGRVITALGFLSVGKRGVYEHPHVRRTVEDT